MKQLIALLIFLPFTLVAQNKFLQDLNASKRAESRSQSRWTLEGWLAQKERNKMMDLWLAMNQPSPYEFYLSIQNLNVTQKQIEADTEDQYTTVNSTLAAYASFVGLEANYSNNYEQDLVETKLSLNLRVLGNSQQSTNLTIGYGQKLTDYLELESLRQTYLKANLTVYIIKHFGLYGEYQQYTPTTHDTFGDISGYNQEYGLFIDYSFIRIFGATYLQKQETDLNGSVSNEEESGVKSGITFFF